MPDSPTETHEVSSVRAGLTERGVIVTFSTTGGRFQTLRWVTRNAAQVLDLARQLASLAHGAGSNECLCDVFKRPCPVCDRSGQPAQTK